MVKNLILIVSVAVIVLVLFFSMEEESVPVYEKVEKKAPVRDYEKVIEEADVPTPRPAKKPVESKKSNIVKKSEYYDVAGVKLNPKEIKHKLETKELDYERDNSGAPREFYTDDGVYTVTLIVSAQKESKAMPTPPSVPAVKEIMLPNGTLAEISLLHPSAADKAILKVEDKTTKETMFIPLKNAAQESSAQQQDYDNSMAPPAPPQIGN